MDYFMIYRRNAYVYSRRVQSYHEFKETGSINSVMSHPWWVTLHISFGITLTQLYINFLEKGTSVRTHTGRN